MSDSQCVTIGVPVYRGERFLEETLQSIQNQLHREFEVVISLDGEEPASEAICEPFLRDSRFRLIVQPERLGWVGQLNWLMSRVTTPYWCYQQQDDLLDPRYLQVLVHHARHWTDAAVVYCDMVAFGTKTFELSQPAVTGPPSARQLALLYAHHPAVAFRGVTRVEALRASGGIPANEVDNFSCDTTWMSAVARWGELRRVPNKLYRKRYHDDNEHVKWSAWSTERRTHAWMVHCSDMLEQAMFVDATPQERRLLWLAAVARLISPRTAKWYVPLAEMNATDRLALLDEFLAYVRRTRTVNIPALLDADWPDVARWTRDFYWLPPAESS